MTLLIRDASTRSLLSTPLIPGSPTSYSSLALSHLHEFASTPFLWCESLVLPDPYMALPLMVGLAALANVEVSAGNRLRMQENAAAVADARAQVWESGQGLGAPMRSSGGAGSVGNNMSVAAKRRMAIQAARTRGGAGTRGYASRSPPSSSPPATTSTNSEDNLKAKAKSEARSTLVTFIMRVAAIGFIPFAAFSPSVSYLSYLLLYFSPLLLAR
ncbi:hypothetical protein P7C70_g815, partial [Phenoliferia sp. Uapishka_3]